MAYISPSTNCVDKNVNHTVHCLGCGKPTWLGKRCCGRSLTTRNASPCGEHIQTPEEKYSKTVIAEGLRHKGRTFSQLRNGSFGPYEAETMCGIRTEDFNISKKRPPKCPACF